MSNFYWTEMEIWAGFGPVSNTQKKIGGPIMSNFWGRFFHVFRGNFFYICILRSILVSALTGASDWGGLDILVLKSSLSCFAGPLEIVPQVNLDALNRFLVDPINAAANAKIDALNDLGLAAGNIGNILSSNIIDTANAQVNNTYCFP